MPDVAPQYQAVLRVKTPGELSKGIGALRETRSTLFVGESHHYTICGHSMLENPIVAAWVPCSQAILKHASGHMLHPVATVHLGKLRRFAEFHTSHAVYLTEADFQQACREAMEDLHAYAMAAERVRTQAQAL
jgi:hypothetical protein